jgi:two-component system, sensor histidine kinase RegB
MSIAIDNPSATELARLADTARWLAKLRWVAAVGQLLTVAFVALILRVPLLWLPLGLLIGVTFVSNAAFVGWLRSGAGFPVCRVSAGQALSTWGRLESLSHLLGGIMLLDLVVLTAMLYFSGGPTNPFVIFYFVNVALSGVVLTPRWAWLVNGVAIVAVVLLSIWHQPMSELRDSERLLPLLALPHVPIATLGGLVAFVACSTVIVTFTTRLTTELRANERLRRRAEALRARSEKLEALGTLAAGAAHELATPLGTIAVVARELERHLETSANAKETGALADVELIRTELERCRAILDRMSLKAGQASASDVRTITGAELVAAVQNELPAPERLKVNWSPGANGAKLQAPVETLAQSLRAVVMNAVDASPPGETVRMRMDVSGRMLRIEIIDRGAGMPPDVAARAGEPFFTTKPTGQGMGLGLFLARSVVERLEGQLTIYSELGVGTTVTIELPRSDR